MLPGSKTEWWFAVAANRTDLDAQITRVRSILVWSFVVLGLGLFLMAVLQTWYGLGPLRRVRLAIMRMRTTGTNRVTDPLPLEVQPLVQELNALLDHSVKQAEEARTHAGNLAHALKTPLTVVMNAATAKAPDLADTVIREAAVMRRQVDHHLARARAVGRRAVGLSRASVGESVEAVLRAVTRLYEDTRFDLAGNREVLVAIERQDLDEILGNLVENAAKYGGGSVFVTIDAEPDAPECLILVEDDGMGIPAGGAHPHLRPRRTARYRQARHGPRSRDRARRGGDLRRHGRTRRERGSGRAARRTEAAARRLVKPLSALTVNTDTGELYRRLAMPAPIIRPALALPRRSRWPVAPATAMAAVTAIAAYPTAIRTAATTTAITMTIMTAIMAAPASAAAITAGTATTITPA